MAIRARDKSIFLPRAILPNGAVRIREKRMGELPIHGMMVERSGGSLRKSHPLFKFFGNHEKLDSQKCNSKSSHSHTWCP
eukprot:9362026-Pyramimonas_sp.AAC.1